MSRERLAAASGGLSACILGLALLLYVVPTYVPTPEYSAGGAPGPQAFPLTIAWGFIVLGGLDVLTVLVSGERIRWRKPEALGRLAAVAGILLAALVAIPYLGMLPVCLAFMIAVTTLCSGQRLLASAVTAVLFTLAIYVIFVLVAGIPLPVGAFLE